MKFSLGFGALKSGLGVLKNFPAIIGYLQTGVKYLKLFQALQGALKVPAANLLFEVKKQIRNLADGAAQNDLNGDGDKLNDIDDKIFAGALKAVDAVLEFFHIKDDCDRLEELDRAVSP